MSRQESTRVLIVEDNSLISEIIKGLLEEAGYTVVGEVADGLKAVEMTQSIRPDVVLMDIRMPLMDGIEATRLIFERCPTPVVVLTAYDTPDLVERASAAGAGAYLVKPPNAHEIEHAITIAMARFNDIMELRRLNAELQAEIAERKRAEEALRESKELFEKTFISQRDAIFILDAKNPPTILDCNPATMEIFGYTRQEMLGHTTTFLHVNETALKKFQELLYPAIEERGFLHLPEFKMKRKDGTVFPTDHSVVPLKDEQGKRIGWVNVVRDIAERKRAEEAVKERERELQRLSAQLINAQEAERQKISQELHDEMGQALTAMSINLAAIEKELPSELAPTIGERLAETSALADQTLEQVRELSLDLRPSMLDDLGLVPTLRWYVNRYAKRSNIEIEFEATDFEERLPAEMETALYRAVQEALTNVARHAQANKVRVRLERKKSKVRLFIEDDGQGFDIQEVAGRQAPERGWGLLGIRERVTSLGGRFRIRSRPGRGTRLTLEIPIT